LARRRAIRNTLQFLSGDLVSILPNRGAAMVSLHQYD
jgi:hypothetical protein